MTKTRTAEIIRPFGPGETVQEFIRRTGRGGPVNTYNIRMRFGWGEREAYQRLLQLERAGVVRRTGAGPFGFGKRQNWEAM